MRSDPIPDRHARHDDRADVCGTTIARAGEHLVVVVAHPDDESFGCGSLIAAATQAGARVTVVCATRGEAGTRRHDPARAEWPLGMMREAELLDAAAVLGVTDVVLLDHRDSGMSGDADATALIRTPVCELGHELACTLAALQPDVVLTLDGSDGHRDHVHVRDATAVAVARLTGSRRLVHACLANRLMRRWAELLAARDPHSPYLADIGRLGRPDGDLTAIDVSAVRGLREQAIATHRSQASPFDGLPADLRDAFLDTDYVVDATAWVTRVYA